MKAEIARSPEDYRRLGLRPDHIEPWEDGIRTSGEPGTYEWWYFDVHLDDGAKLVVTFFTKPFVGVARPMTPMISIELDMPGGRTLAKMLQAPPEDFTAATDHCDVRIRGNSFVGDLHTYRIQAAIEEVSVDVELVGEVPSWRPGTGHMYFGEGEQRKLFAWLPVVPQGKVTATYTVDGQARRTTGVGYHDHNWGDTDMTELIHDWYWARGKAGPYTVVASRITAEEKYGYAPITIFMLARDGTIIADDSSKVTFSSDRTRTDEPTGKPFEDITRYDYIDGDDRYTVTFTRDKTIYRLKFLEVMPQQQRAQAQAAGFDGAYLRVTGDLNITHQVAGTERNNQTQQAIWERMYFGKTL